MVSLQILSKVINTSDFSIIENNSLTRDLFSGYENEFDFITEHYKQYNCVPDKATFLSKFNNIELVDVQESDKYLVDTLREEKLYTDLVPVIQKSADIATKGDANKAVDYLKSAMSTLQTSYNLGGVNIIKETDLRLNEYKERREHQDDWYFTTGFKELDDIIHGIQRGEELIVLFARINQGKSWISEKIANHIWGLGFNVGYISPEMSASAIGYRFDTLQAHISNKNLMYGSKELDEEQYKLYLDTLKTKDNKFIVSTPLDFNKKITVSKVKNWIIQNNLDFIAIDGIKYMTDERHQRGDNKTTTLTNISEDLMSLSMELQIPILVVVQANRSGVNKESDDNPDLDAISDSDGIGQNASKVLALRQLQDKTLKLTIKKNRFGSVGDDVHYDWNIDTGEFRYKKVPADDNVVDIPVTGEVKEGTDLF